MIAYIGYDHRDPSTGRERRYGFRSAAQDGATGFGSFLGGDAAREFDRILREALKVAGNEPFDRAMDAVYNELSRAGGGLHRLFDGSHTLVGAWKAINDKLGHLGLTDRIEGWVLGLWNDAITPNGLPLWTLSQEQYRALVEFLGEAGISRQTIQDALTYTSSEALGAIAGIAAALLHLRRERPDAYIQLAAGLGVTAAVAGNPLAFAVAVCVALRAEMLAAKTGRGPRRGENAALGAAGAAGGWGFSMLGFMAGGPIVALIAAIFGAVAARLSVQRFFARRRARRVFHVVALAVAAEMQRLPTSSSGASKLLGVSA